MWNQASCPNLLNSKRSVSPLRIVGTGYRGTYPNPVDELTGSRINIQERYTKLSSKLEVTLFRFRGNPLS